MERHDGVRAQNKRWSGVWEGGRCPGSCGFSWEGNGLGFQACIGCHQSAGIACCVGDFFDLRGRCAEGDSVLLEKPNPAGGGGGQDEAWYAARYVLNHEAAEGGSCRAYSAAE